MTLGDFRELSDGLDDDVEICITVDNISFITACLCSSGITEIEFTDGKDIVLLISPCQDVIEEILIEDAEDKLYQISEN